MYCKKCGREIDDNQLVCGYCGHALSQLQLSTEKKIELRKNKYTDKSLKANHNARIRGLGIILMVIGGIVDLVSIAMIWSSSVEEFSTILIFSSVTFGLGFLLTFAFR